ncbi:TRAP transporter large permease subunit [Pseudovibrio exalbescens]|uniref:TRAP transporter large permease n=1 Tax=Pseudovibrio exalbescens TaxID=197461 RepID=UPI0023666E4D|nr:TRAP transporter large permease subunit [Pseudovibrio exalbescens]MDD7911720.1 TRAP transporter large permease subunit [Pseudovibrio exalbescens]
METAVLFLMVFGLLLIGAPIAIALGLSAVLYIALFSHDSMSSVAVQLFTASQNFTLLAIPFFILASSFMSTGGVARRIVNFAVATVGSFRGGLAIAGVFACMIFAALSGSSPATVVAIGTIAIAAMRKAGYSKEFAAGVIANAGTLGILIPPSIVMVVYAAATNVSVGRMFLAGVVPGLVAGLMLMGAIYFIARRRNLPAQPFPSLRVLWSTFSEAAFGMFLIVIILGGIYGGIFTPTEAAAVAAVYAAFIALFVYRDMGPLTEVPWRRPGESLGGSVLRNLWMIGSRFVPALFHRDTKKVLTDSAKTTVMLMFIIVNALLFAHTLTAERIPQLITDWMIDAGFNWFTFLIAVNIMLLIGGQFMEPSGLLLIVAPVVFPIGIELGVDPIHLGIIMVVNMEIGMITPPIGLNLFVTSGITGMSLLQVVKAAAPFVLVLLVFLILVTYVPWLSTALPTALMGPEVIIR